MEVVHKRGSFQIMYFYAVVKATRRAAKFVLPQLLTKTT